MSCDQIRGASLHRPHRCPGCSLAGPAPTAGDSWEGQAGPAEGLSRGAKLCAAGGGLGGLRADIRACSVRGTAPSSRRFCSALDLLPPEVCSLLNPAAIYANNEISLQDVEVYGFDYDYTLAQYADALHPEIFNAARDILIENYKVG